MKQKMKDEMARIFLSSRDGAPISSAESQDIISRIKKEADEAHAEKLKALELKSKFSKFLLQKGPHMRFPVIDHEQVPALLSCFVSFDHIDGRYCLVSRILKSC